VVELKDWWGKEVELQFIGVDRRDWQYWIPVLIKPFFFVVVLYSSVEFCSYFVPYGPAGASVLGGEGVMHLCCCLQFNFLDHRLN